MVHDLKMKIAGDIEKQLSLSPATINQPSGTTNGSHLKGSMDSRTKDSDPSKWKWLEEVED
jgi:hypothetical protein